MPIRAGLTSLLLQTPGRLEGFRTLRLFRTCRQRRLRSRSSLLVCLAWASPGPSLLFESALSPRPGPALLLGLYEDGSTFQGLLGLFSGFWAFFQPRSYQSRLSYAFSPKGRCRSQGESACSLDDRIIIKPLKGNRQVGENFDERVDVQGAPVIRCVLVYGHPHARRGDLGILPDDGLHEITAVVLFQSLLRPQTNVVRGIEVVQKM